MDIKLIITNLNSGSTLDNESKVLGISKRTLQRRIKENGYFYDRKECKYLFQNLNTENNTDCNIENNIDGVTINRTYGIERDTLKALRIKSAIEDKDMSLIVNEALKKHIEDKYYHLNI